MQDSVNFTRYVDDYRFYANKVSDLELLKYNLIKIFKEYHLQINSAKEKMYKGFEIAKQANIEKYIWLEKLIRKNKFEFKDYIIFRKSIIELIELEEISTIKAVLTKLTNRILKDKISFDGNGIAQSLTVFLIKLSFVQPIFASRVYNLIRIIGLKSTIEIRRKIWDTLFTKISYIKDVFSDTDLEIWFYYVLTDLGTSEKISKVLTMYMEGREYKNINVLVLVALLKTNSKKTNNRIQNILLKLSNSNGDSEKFWQSVSQSKWWILIAKLRMVANDYLDKNIKKLFVAKNKGGNIQWDKMGIIEYLCEQEKL